MKAPFRYYDSPTFVFSPEDRLLLRYGVHSKEGREASLWDTETGEKLASLPIDGTAAAVSPDGEWLAMGRSDPKQAIALWNPTSLAKEQQVTEDHVYWHDRSTEQWTTGLRIIKRPNLDDPQLVIEYLLRNEADSPRIAALSFTSGMSRFLVDAQRNIKPWPGAEESRSYLVELNVAAGGTLTDPRFRQAFDLTGLEAGTYHFQASSFFFVPTDEPSRRRGVPLHHEFSFTIKDHPAQKSEKEILRTDSEKNHPTVQWGDQVAGLRVGLAWSPREETIPAIFEHGELITADLFVQNVSDMEIDCSSTLPHSMDGWGFSIHHSEGRHITRNQIFFTGFEPQRTFVATLSPGEVKRLTGSPSQFQEKTEEGLVNAPVPQLQFVIAAEPPKTPEARPPYTYGLPTDS
ncbi:Hypothetical protein PBC10988_4520 [Planctomycetales bacterium 10988]|nr:Hypothetical protein PBC10988_4520 [Planctomycetales bacterium 10988]